MPKPDYGVDAPNVIRNLVAVGSILLVVFLLSLGGILPREFVGRPFGLIGLRFPLGVNTLIMAAAFLGAAAWMYVSSTVGKVAERDRFLSRIEWAGHERVLDVGCGRGLLLVGVAKRLTDGRAVGIDIWQAEDLSGNRAEVPRQNAALEGVADRVFVHTADMRRLPFRSGAFDAIVSRAAIHNLYSAADRAMAIKEIARVLKPGGRALIADIRHHREYARTFAESGCDDVRLLGSPIVSALFAVVTLGNLRPNTMLVKK